MQRNELAGHDGPLTILRPIEVANVTRLSVRKLAALRMAGGGPDYIKLGHRTVVYSETAVKAWLETHCRRSTSDTQAVA